MMHTNHTSSETINAYLEAIESSIKHFVTIQNRLKKLAGLSDNDGLNFLDVPSLVLKQANHNEPICFSKVNYIAILALEKLGVNSPSQKQIDIMESVIFLCLRPGKLTREKINLCVGEDNLAKRILIRELKTQ